MRVENEKLQNLPQTGRKGLTFVFLFLKLLNHHDMLLLFDTVARPLDGYSSDQTNKLLGCLTALYGLTLLLVYGVLV